MTSNQHGPYVRGYTRVTMAGTERRSLAKWIKSLNPVSITIPANKNPSLIGITVYIVLERETGVGIAISSLSIDQKGTK